MQQKLNYLLTNHYLLKQNDLNPNKCILTEFMHDLKQSNMKYELLKDGKTKMMARISSNGLNADDYNLLYKRG